VTVADNSIIRAAAHFIDPTASDVVNVFHFVMDSVGDVSEANVLIDIRGYIQGLMSHVQTFYGTDQELDEVLAWVRNTTTNQWDFIGSIAGTWAGTTASTERLPAQNAPQVNANTTNAHSHGRKYLMAPLETATAAGGLAGAFQTSLTSYFSSLVATHVGSFAEYAVGVWSEKLQNFLQFSGGGGIRSLMGTQRRRKVGVGE